jgi:hypothetical protein
MATSDAKSVPRDEDLKLPEEHQFPVGVDDAAPIPKGQIDPVYEAKARVLNHAVRVAAVHMPLVTKAS